MPLSAIQKARIPAAYTSPPTNQTLYFGERGSVNFAGAHIFDLGLSYSVPVWKTIRPWFKLELRNAFNNDKLTTWNIAITPDNDRPQGRRRPAHELHQGQELRARARPPPTTRSRASSCSRVGFRF